MLKKRRVTGAESKKRGGPAADLSSCLAIVLIHPEQLKSPLSRRHVPGRVVDEPAAEPGSIAGVI